MPAKNHIDLVVKTLKVMEALALVDEGIPLKEITERVDMVKSSTFRILFTLREAGYVEQSADGTYRLTLKAAALAPRRSGRMNLAGIARPHLVRLRDRLDESVALGERRGQSVELTEAVETSHPLRLTFQPGNDCPIHATAMGKAVAAFLPEKQLQALLKTTHLHRYTRRTISSVTRLKNEIAQVRKNGYAVNDEETMAGAYLAGAPIFDAGGTVCGAISLNAPTARCTPARKRKLIGEVMTAAEAISNDLANAGFIYSPPPSLPAS